MAAKELANICSVLTPGEEYDFYPILSDLEKEGDTSYIHNKIPELHKYDMYGILLSMNQLKRNVRGTFSPVQKFEMLASLINVASDYKLKVHIYDRRQTDKDNKRFYLYSIRIVANTLSGIVIDYSKIRTFRRKFFKIQKEICDKKEEKSKIQNVSPDKSTSSEKNTPAGCSKRKNLPPSCKSPVSMKQKDDFPLQSKKQIVSPDKGPISAKDPTRCSKSKNLQPSCKSTASMKQKDVYPLLSGALIDKEDSCTNSVLPKSIEIAVKLNQLMREIEQFSQEHNIIIDRNNGTFSHMFFIPRLSNQKSFNDWERKHNKMDDIVKFMSNEKRNKHGHPVAAEFIANFLFRTYRQTIFDTIESNDMTVMERMDVIETAALLSDANVPDAAILDKVHRHLKSKSVGGNFCAFANREEMNKVLASEMPSITYSSYEYEKEAGKKKEKVEFASVEIEESLCLDMNRCLMNDMKQNLLAFPMCNTSGVLNTHSPIFGYTTKSSDKGIYVLVGTDHGKGHSQCAMRFNLKCSTERRQRSKAEYGTRFLPYCVIKCKKDVTEILRLTAGVTNRGIELLQKHQLLAITGGNDSKVWTFFAPTEMSKYRIVTLGNMQRQIILSNVENCRSKIIPVPQEFQLHVRIRVVIKKFHVLQVGDLAAQVATQGREHMSSSRCFKCNLTASQWKNGEIGTILTLEDLLNHPNLAIGQKQALVWLMGGNNSITPVLHCQIGTGNYQIFVMLAQLLIEIDSQTNDEYEKRTSLQVLLAELIDEKEELVTMTAAKEIRSASIADDIKEHRRTILNARRRRLTAEASVAGPVREERIQAATANISSSQTVIDQLQEEITLMKVACNRMDTSIKNKSKRATELRLEVKALAEGRKKEANGLDTLLECTLKKYGASVQSYHGGTLHGKDIVKVCNNWEPIMNEVQIAASTRLHQRHLQHTRSPTSRPPPSIAEVEMKLNLHRKLLQAQDAVYSHLRIVDPSEEEKTATRTSIEIMKRFWFELKCSETHKAHLIFQHAADDQDEFGGLGDKGEDDWERRHQVQAKFDHILHRMCGGWQKQISTQLKYEWRNNDPRVEKQIIKVHEKTSRKRKLSPDITLKEERFVRSKEERCTNRLDFIAANII